MLIIGEIGEVVKIALFVAYRKQSIIYFLIAPMLDFCGLQYICYLESQMIYLIVGLKGGVLNTIQVY